MGNSVVTLVIGAVLIALLGFVILHTVITASSAQKTKRQRSSDLPTRGPRAIRAALTEAIATADAVIFTDITAGSLEKFVQFAVEDGKLLLDVPQQQMSDQEQQAMETLAGFSKSVEGSYQMQMPDVESAVKVADNIFQNIFKTPVQYELEIEFI